jgi:glycerol-3-phosphate dehydrogenase (NAD(P)+)
MKITLLGAGAWGTALASTAARRHDVMLWARDARQAERLATTRRNQAYLPDVALPQALRCTADFDAAVGHAAEGLLVIATPMAALRDSLQRLPAGRAALWLCKGFESGSGALGHEVAAAVRPGVACGVLSGPSFALEVARGQPTALLVASQDVALVDQTVEAFHGDALRIYSSVDVIGVEVGGAVKNVLAIATGICDGMAALPSAELPPPGLNARAALITRGLAEMTRLGVALGARAETFMGLSGLGDLVLTATGELSRNRRVGLGLAAGQSLPQVLSDLGHVAEGVYSAATVVARARSLGVEMPISEAVVEVLTGRIAPQQALWQLMSRQPRAESQPAASPQRPPA